MADRPSLWQRLTQAVSAGRQTALRRMGLDRVQSVMVDLSKEEMVRIGLDTKDVKGVYFSDFVEHYNPNQIRPAREFRKTVDTLVTDRKIPLSRISRFYGVEDGKVKVGGIGNFRDSTVVVPVRNKNYGKVSGIAITKDSESLWNRISFNWVNPFAYRRTLRKELDSLSVGFGYEGTKPEDYHKRLGFMKESLENLNDKFRELDKKIRSSSLSYEEREKGYEEGNKISVESNELYKQIKEYEKVLTMYFNAMNESVLSERYLPRLIVRPSVHTVSFLNEKGNRISDELMTRAADGKIVFSDSTGRGLFINDLEHFSNRDLKELNGLLSEHPLYPVLVDNGRYSHYQLEAGSYRDYIRQDLYRPDKDLFVVGSVDRAKERGVSRKGGEAEAQERRMGNAKRYKKFMEDAAKTVERGIGIR